MTRVASLEIPHNVTGSNELLRVPIRYAHRTYARLGTNSIQIVPAFANHKISVTVQFLPHSIKYYQTSLGTPTGVWYYFTRVKNHTLPETPD